MENKIKIKISTIKLNIFYAALIITTCFDFWLQETVFLSLGPINIYAIDCIHVLIIYAIIRVLLSGHAMKAIKEEPVYVMFLLWIGVEIAIGYTRYGFRSLGETRTASNFLTFFVPYFLVRKNQYSNTSYIMNLIFKTVLCCAVAGIATFIVRAGLGIETITDFRGVRYMGTTTTYSVTLLICFYIFKYTFSNVLLVREILLLVVSVAIAVLSKNRAGLVFPGAVTFLCNIKYMKARMLMYSVVAVTSLIFAAKLLTPETVVSGVDEAFSGVIDPASDNTGKWRMAIQLVALQQAFETFWFGQGYGGYFNLVVAEKYRSVLYETTPHNQFLVIFLKTGVIGVLLLASLLLVYIYKSIKMLNKLPNTSNEKVFILLLLVIVSSQFFYGMTYEFIPLFGIYYGFGALLIRSINQIPVTEMAKKENTL